MITETRKRDSKRYCTNGEGGGREVSGRGAWVFSNGHWTAFLFIHGSGTGKHLRMGRAPAIFYFYDLHGVNPTKLWELGLYVTLLVLMWDSAADGSGPVRRSRGMYELLNHTQLEGSRMSACIFCIARVEDPRGSRPRAEFGKTSYFVSWNATRRLANGRALTCLEHRSQLVIRGRKIYA